MISGYSKETDERIHAGFGLLRRRVNEVFPHWRRVVECDYTDVEMAEIAAQSPPNGSAQLEDTWIEPDVARMRDHGLFDHALAMTADTRRPRGRSSALI